MKIFQRECWGGCGEDGDENGSEDGSKDCDDDSAP